MLQGGEKRTAWEYVLSLPSLCYSAMLFLSIEKGPCPPRVYNTTRTLQECQATARLGRARARASLCCDNERWCVNVRFQRAKCAFILSILVVHGTSMVNGIGRECVRAGGGERYDRERTTDELQWWYPSPHNACYTQPAKRPRAGAGRTSNTSKHASST